MRQTGPLPSARNSYVTLSDYYTTGEGPVISKVDVTVHLRGRGNVERDTRKIVDFYYAEDEEGRTPRNGPADESAGSIQRALVLENGTYAFTISNVFDTVYEGYLVVILPDGAVTTRLDMPGSTV